MLRITAMELFVFVGLFLLPLVNSADDHVNMDNPEGEHYCPMPKDPWNQMSYSFKEDTCRTYIQWCKNLETHPFEPTSSQTKWWDVLSVDKFYNHMEKPPLRRPGRRGKRQAVTRSVRRDYRLLSSAERDRFHRAIRRLKDSFMDGTRTYDIFVGYHQASMAPGAHFGPAFMPWHREFMLRYCISLNFIIITFK